MISIFKFTLNSELVAYNLLKLMTGFRKCLFELRNTNWTLLLKIQFGIPIELIYCRIITIFSISGFYFYYT